jgi:hypothetical protein
MSYPYHSVLIDWNWGTATNYLRLKLTGNIVSFSTYTLS